MIQKNLNEKSPLNIYQGNIKVGKMLNTKVQEIKASKKQKIAALNKIVILNVSFDR